MNTIWKYQMSVIDYNEITIPIGAQILDIQFQGPHMQLWALVDPDADQELRTFAIYGTGHPIEGRAGRYVATVQDPPLVWHVFDLGSVGPEAA